MTTAPAAAYHSLARDFRVGRVFDLTTGVYTGNFPAFALVALAASLPALAGFIIGNHPPDPNSTGGVWGFLAVFGLSYLLFLLSQGILVYAAFEALRGRVVDLGASLQVGLSRLFQMTVIAISVGMTFAVIVFGAVGFEVVVVYSAPLSFPTWLAGYLILLGLFSGLVLIGMLASRWFVAVPVCIVERLGAWRSLGRSAVLTKGSRWRIFAIILFFFVGAIIVGQIMVTIIDSLGGFLAGLMASIIWRTLCGAYLATFVVVTYYELRVAHEGIDVEQIAAVFD